MKPSRVLPAFLPVLLVLGAALPAAAQLTTSLEPEALEAFRWRSIGPANMAGRITDVEGIPGPSKTFYAAAASGGIWKTTNNGVTFRPIFDEARVAAMGDIAIAPSDTLQIWAGTGEEDSRNSISPGGGIFRSLDGGETWEFKGLKETEVIARIVVHPDDPDVVWVAALGHIWDENPERGLYKTTDGGDSWRMVKHISERAGFVDVAIHPRNPDVLFASSWERIRGPYFLQSGGPGSALWKSTDGGASWSEVTGGGFPTTLKGRIGIAISQSHPDVMYTLVEAEEEEDGSGGNGLYRSGDGGATWEKVNDANTRPFYYSQVRVDPRDPDRVYWSSTPVQVSDDGGRTVGTTTIGIHVDHHALWIDPSDPDRMVAGNDGGLAITWDKGGNWWFPNHMGALGQFYHVSYNMDAPYRVCGGLQDNGTWCGPSRVAGDQVSNYHWATISGGDGFYTAQDPVDHHVVFAESQGGNMARIDMRTGERSSLGRPDWEERWRPLQDTIVMLLEEGVGEDDARIRDLEARASADSASLQLRYNWNTPFLISPHDRMVFYAGANRVLKSTDRGETLEPISPDLSYGDTMKIRVSTRTTGGITPDVTGAETFGTIVALAESPLRRGWLYAGTDDGRVWTTRDDGGEWIELTGRFQDVPEGTYVSRIEPSHHDENRVYVTFDGHRANDFTPYVFVTDDGGASFRSLAEGLPTGGPDFLHVVREDPHNPDLLFVGSDVGVYMSTDRGGVWQRFMTGLPAVPVHDLQIHPRDRELIAGTHGRSIWIVDIGPLEQLSDAVMADGAALFEPQPAVQWGSDPRGGESYGQAWFQRPTPGSDAQVAYWISQEVADELREAVRATAEQAGAAGGAGGDGADRGDRGDRGDRASEADAGEDAPRGRQQSRLPRARVVIEGPDGQPFRVLEGPTSAGFHRVSWNFRGEQAESEGLSPSERRDSLERARRVEVVVDSLLSEGWEEEPLRRMAGLFTGETDRQAMFRGFGGGAQGGRDPEAFQERPGESFGGGGPGGPGGAGFDFSRMRELADLVVPGGGLRSVFRGGGGGEAPVAEPGLYTVRLELGERTFTTPLEVERSSTAPTAAGELDVEAFLRWLKQGGS